MSIENWEENGVRSNFVKFNKVGDFIKGTLTEMVTPDKPDAYGKKERKLTVKAVEGKWHEADGSEVDAVPGEMYRVGAKPGVEAQITSSVLGHRMMFKLTELRKNNKGNPTKIITVLTQKDPEGRPVFDQEWLKEKSDTNLDEAAAAF